LRKPKNSEKNLPHCHFFNTNPTWTAVEFNSGPPQLEAGLNGPTCAAWSILIVGITFGITEF
jgi:hypothetical protein